MCGIAAILPLAATPDLPPPVDPAAALMRMLGALRHRGDSWNFAEHLLLPVRRVQGRRAQGREAQGAGGAMGTNRLAIVDRAHGRQPVVDPASGRLIVMNGEIYNHEELRAELEAGGHHFRTASDTETVLAAFGAWGPACVDRLDGIFAFVIHDPATGSSFAARDHLGIKPLYMATAGGWVAFASERKAFIGLIAGVTELAPGHVWADGRISRYAGFQAAHDPAVIGPDPVGRCRALLDAAVRRQVQTDLPLAVIFSGGLDSTILLHLATRHHPDVTAFSVGTEDSEDLAFARAFCAERGIRHIVTGFAPEMIPRRIRGAIFDGEFFEPVDISDMISMSAVHAAVRANGFKVAIAGDGADELFAGYDMFRTAADPYALTTYRVGNLHRTDLQRTDRASMTHSVECRVPFLDRALVDFAMALPFDLKLRGGVEKWILREAFRGEIADVMIDRPKIRMPEGIGIRDRIFRHLAHDRPGRELTLPPVTIDTPQVRNALLHYLDFGFDAPASRYKSVGTDYAPGGYFRFDATSEATATAI